MNSDREKLIRDHWPIAARYGFKNGPRVRVPLHFRVRPPSVETDEMPDFKINTLEYELQHGQMGDRPWTRVVCEGVVVSQGPA
ncbi:hypothetical protein [Nitratireductor soli]|uniref:hypothetical protein n=1 Tax=Nitratireductor soli TaxID=1670619 RepID=UPI000AC8B942|nr:hypothetical protein [Nitratireductor soli]